MKAPSPTVVMPMPSFALWSREEVRSWSEEVIRRAQAGTLLISPDALHGPESWIGAPAVLLPSGLLLTCLAPGHALVRRLDQPTPVEWKFIDPEGTTLVWLGGQAWSEPGEPWLHTLPALATSASSAWPHGPGHLLVTQPSSLLCRRPAERLSHRLVLPHTRPFPLRPAIPASLADGLFA